MGLLDRILGNEEKRHGSGTQPITRPNAAQSADQVALERYRYLVRTAPPETIEQAHTEAFSQLNPEQRREILGQLANAAPANERAAAQQVSPEDPRAMGQLATRTELRQPGFMERTLGSSTGGLGLGGSLLASFAMGFAGSMIANSFFQALEGHDGVADATPADVNEGDTSNVVDDTSSAAEGDFDMDMGGDGLGGDFDV